ncbi:helix-turn-helix domain-containing protein [Ktedonobacter sp. SOSP1-52]|uniref:helix-turn-helix domain-containing protein n=1 Tax=Ktedonobacter sp. SOSP1-52 TaxID=2778366 RepID=UPI0035AE65A1
MEEKSRYTLRDLFNHLPISLAELARRSGVNEVTIARIRNGESVALRSTANKLLRVFSEVYNRPLTLDNVDFPVRG